MAFDDYLNALRFADRVEAVTSDSVLDLLPRAQLTAAAVTLQWSEKIS